MSLQAAPEITGDHGLPAKAGPITTHALIIGDHTQGLGIIRCLAHRRYRPVMLWDRIFSLSRFSRHLYAYRRVPRGTMSQVYDPVVSDALVAAIKRIVPEGEQWPVFTVHDDLVLFLHHNRKRLQDRLLIPDNNIPAIIDKYRFAQNLKSIEIDTPETILLSDFTRDQLKNGRHFVAKGRLGNRFRNISNRKGKILQSTRDLEALMTYVDDHVPHGDVIVQEKIETNQRVLSCCGLAIDGKIVRSFQYIKLRQHPDEFGTGTFLQSIQRDDLLAAAGRITGHFGYTGIFEIEFIQKPDGRLAVIEMNPRTWKSIHFAALCGQNLCAAYCDYLVQGTMPPENHRFEVGRTWVDIVTDLPQAVRQHGLKGIRYCRNTFHCVANVKDPLPFLVEILFSPLLALGI